MKTSLYRLIIFLILGLSAIAAMAGGELKSTFHTTADGLPNNTVRQVVQDSVGYIWIASNYGLTRYDGYRFENFDPAKARGYISPHFRDIRIGPHGYLWIMCGDNEVACFDPEEKTFVDYSSTGKLELPYRFNATVADESWLWGDKGAMRVRIDGKKFSATVFDKNSGRLGADKVERVAADHLGRVWIGAKDGCYVVENEDAKLIIPGHPFRFMQAISTDATVAVLGNGDIYLITRQNPKGKKVAKIPAVSDQLTLTGHFIDRGLWRIFTTHGAYEVDLSTFKVSPAGGLLNVKGAEVITDRQGDRWLHNHSGKIVYYNSKTGEACQFEIMSAEQSRLLDSERINIDTDGKGLAWISTKGKGLFSFDKATHELTHYTEESKVIPSELLLCLMVDRNGQVWTGSEYTGLTQIESFQSPDMLLPEGMKAGGVRMVKKIGREILIADRGGNLYRYDSKLEHLVKKEKYPSVVYDFIRDSQGREWVATRGNGIYVDGVNYHRQPGVAGALPSNSVFALLEDKQRRIWIGTLDFGLALAEKNDDGTLGFRRFFDKVTGRRFVRSLASDHNGNVWAGTDEGLLVFNPTKFLADMASYKVYSPLDGSFANNTVNALVEDRDRRMWIATGGAGVAIAYDIADIDNLKFNYVGKAEGLANQAVQAVLTLPYGDGAIVTTEYGISRINSQGRVVDNLVMAAKPKSNVYAPNSLISLDGSSIVAGSFEGLYEISQHDPSDKELPTVVVTDQTAKDNGELTIAFSTLDYQTLSHQIYSFMLEGHDKGWSTPSESSETAYTGLGAGKYRFHVKAMSDNGQWGPETVVEIRVDRPWHTSPWAMVLIALVVVGSLFIAWKAMRKLKARADGRPAIPDSPAATRFAIEPQPEDDTLARLEEIVTRNLGNSDFTVDDFATEMKMGRTVFFRKVKDLTGCSPKQYLLKARMAKAARLLSATDKSVAEISYTVGFAEPAYFNNSFKAVFGKTPGQYRQDARKEEKAD